MDDAAPRLPESHVIDGYATKFQEYTTAQFFRGVSALDRPGNLIIW
jgi:hypothetical protein